MCRFLLLRPYLLKSTQDSSHFLFFFTFILFSRAQKATRQLDMSKDFTEPIESWFWPKVFQENTDENETDLEEPKIKDITNEEQIQGVQFYPQHFCRRSRADLVISISVLLLVVELIVRIESL